MTILTVLAFFTLGLIGGVIGCGCILLYEFRKHFKANKKESKEPKESSISDRMKRIKEITSLQLDLNARANGPQKNALDGKYKNSLISHQKMLDDEKNNIFRSLLSDGHDLELTTMDGAGVVTKLKLSEYMSYMGIEMTPSASVPSKPTKAERINKFTLHHGGRDDNSGDTSH